MTEFEKVLQECLLALERGDSNMDECLRRHPRHALQLEPILLTSMYLEHGREARPSAAFKARVRSRLIQGMQAHPRTSARFNFIWMRVAMNLAVILLALLAAGTAYAQGALPGNAFYAWKLASEHAWQALSPDPVGTDLAIADRRKEELIAVANDPVQRTQVLITYLEVVARLESGMTADNEARIRLALASQIEELNKSGIFLPQLEQDIVPELDEPAAIPTETHPAMPGIPQIDPTLPVPAATSFLIQETAQAPPTDSPQLVPTIQAPTIQIPPLLP